MNERIPATPPPVLPLSSDMVRPLWSVMIPAYNCIQYLKETIESVLVQDPGPDKMQIEVVDDASSDGDVAALVQAIGQGRVGYYRQEVNKGSLRNFETCINRAKGQWVHLLHGDDKVKEGFYREIETLFNQFPEAGAAFVRHKLMDEQGKEYFRVVSAAGEVANEPGVLADWLSKIAQRNRLQPPAIVVKRSVYEQVGSFFAVHFGEDWEMWVRIASRFPVAYSPKYLAVYRVHANNITSNSFLSGQNIKDLTKVIDIIQAYLPEDKRVALSQQARKNAAQYFLRTARKVLHTFNHPRAALIQAKGAFKMYPSSQNLYLIAKLYAKVFLYYLKGGANAKLKKKPALDKGV